MKTFLKTILIFLIISSLVFSVGLSAAAIFVARHTNAEEKIITVDPSSRKTEFYCFDYDNTRENTKSAKPKTIEGAVLDGGIRYAYVSLDQIPDDLINAFIAIEDKRFYDHFGVDPIRTTKAVFNYLAGRKRFGGSTITQQLVKNLTGRDEATVQRKINEAFAAIRLEKTYDKSEILEQYLNVINLSGGCMGVGAAAEYYYSKKPSELTLAECATIAAITNNPSLYDPAKHPENNKKRRDTILFCMYEQNYISKEQYIEACEAPIKLNKSDKAKNSINSWYIDMVTEDVIGDLCRKYDISRSAAALMLYRGGYKVYTAMDKTVQTLVEEYYANEYNFPIDSNGKMAQSAVIVIDPYTGDIMGVAGAVGQKLGNRVQNYATDVKRPPGSTIKPLSVYAPAMDGGLIEWGSIFEDSPIDTERCWPQNVDRKYRGFVDIKYAVEHSLNTVPVKILDMLGSTNSMDFLKNKLLISSLDESKDLGYASLALGQPTHGLTLRELTAAYSIFEDGSMSRPRSYYKVTDSQGKIILESQSQITPVITRETAAIMTRLLETVVDSGTAAGKIMLDNYVAVAGKSGTSSNCCDRYFIGYTPELLCGVWFGYDYPKSLERFGGNLSVYIWDEVMSEIYNITGRYKKTEFSVPETVQILTYQSPVTDDAGDTVYKSDIGWFNIKHKEE